jgi:hypothetical protein
MATDHRIPRASVAGADQSDRLQAIYVAALDCLLENRIGELTPGMAAVAALFVFAGEVGNGGFEACMYNSSGDHTAAAIEGAERVGADAHAALFRRFADVCLGGDLTMSQEARERRLGNLEGDWEEVLDDLDEAFFALPPIETPLHAYVDAHPDEFFTD